MTDFKNPQDVSGSRWERYSPFKRRSLQAVVALLLLTSSAAMAAPKVIYVNGSRPTNGDGASWASAYRYLRDALAVSAPGDTLYLTKGIYLPDDTETNTASFKGDRKVSFSVNGVSIYGGFIGTENDPSVRVQDPNPNSRPVAYTVPPTPPAFLPETERTILSGKIVATENNWSLHVLQITSNSTLDGVTVENGNANGPKLNIEDQQGGGCLVKGGATLTLNKTEFRNSKAYDSGGGIWGNVVAVDSRFTNNQVITLTDSSEASGGAIKGNVTVTGSTFTGNSVASQSPGVGGNTKAEGGAIAGEVAAKNCEFLLNIATATSSTVGGVPSSATAKGGAVSGVVKASKCRFTSNEAVGIGPNYAAYGGAVAGQFIVESCAFVSNSTSATLPETVSVSNINTDVNFGGGGALCSLEIPIGTLINNKSEVNNSVFSTNTSKFRGGGIFATFGSILTIENSTFLNNGVSGTTSKGSSLCCGGNVTIMNNIFWNSAATSGGFTQNKLISILGKGEIKASGSDTSSPIVLAKNLVYSSSFVALFIEDSGSIIQSGMKTGNTAATQTGSLLPADPKFTGSLASSSAALGAFPAKLEGADGIWGTADDRARLQDTSPAKNVGLARYLILDSLDIDEDGDLTEQIPTDIAGYTRIQNGFPDLGAYENGNLVHAPEISVTYLELPPPGELASIGTPTVNLPIFAGVAKSFVITNLGSANLNRLGVRVTGANVEDFVISQPLTSTVLPQASTTFTIKFVPRAFGVRTATIVVTNDDADENPFQIKVQGDSSLPEIDIQQPLGTALTTGVSEVNFGLVPDLESTERNFTINNLGNTNLILSGFRVEGANASDFIVFAPLDSNVVANGSTTFKVVFKPAAGGSKSATIFIPSTDVDENPFTIKVRGTAPSGDIAVKQADGTEIIDAVTSVDYGKTDYLLTTVKTFTITNNGAGHLVIKGIVSSGTNIADFVISQPANSVILPGKSTTFTVSYSSSASGLRNAQINILSDDPDDESTYTFTVVGSSLLTPRIVVRQPFLAAIVDGASSDFGSVQKSLLYSKKFVISNNGLGVLKGISVNITGSGAFTKTNPSVTILKAGESTNFRVTFKPGSAGIRTAQIQILSNDSTKSPFDLLLTGKGTVKKKKKSILAENGLLSSTPTLTTGNVSVATGSEGLKYLMLTLAKTGNRHAVASDVEVSSNLLDWYSGASYTTTLVDSETLLKVRDDAPVKAGEKRYIRLKPATH
jgi:Protein of unknown function (DUF1573)